MHQVGKGVGELRRWTTQLNTEVHSAFEPGERVPAGSPSTPSATTPAPLPAAEILPMEPTELTASADTGAA